MSTLPVNAPAPSTQPTVQVDAVSVIYPAKEQPVVALDAVSLNIAQGEFISLIGPSGCGKTTLLRVIADLEQATTGRVLVNGMSSHDARLARAYGYVFQAPALFPWRTVLDNVRLPLEIQGVDAERSRGVALEQLERVGLKGFEGKYPWQLSGGMQQRVSIARALGFEPQLLMMDEPFGALDEITRDRLGEQLLQIWRGAAAGARRTVVFVTHSIPEAVFLSTRIVVMSPRPGRIVEVIDSTLPADRTLDIRETPEFIAIAHRVRHGLARWPPLTPCARRAVATASPSAAALLWQRFGPVLTVLAVVVLLWYAAAVWLNAPQVIERVLSNQPGWGAADLMRLTWSMERPVLPAPHQIVAVDLWSFHSSTGRWIRRATCCSMPMSPVRPRCWVF